MKAITGANKPAALSLAVACLQSPYKRHVAGLRFVARTLTISPGCTQTVLEFSLSHSPHWRHSRSVLPRRFYSAQHLLSVRLSVRSSHECIVSKRIGCTFRYNIFEKRTDGRTENAARCKNDHRMIWSISFIVW